MNKHTPLPWVFAYGSVYRADTLHDESSIRIAMMDRNEPHTQPTERDANAEFIVRACNAHEELVAACKMALVQVKQDNDSREVPEDLRLTEYQIRAAIAKAKGES